MIADQTHIQLRTQTAAVAPRLAEADHPLTSFSATFDLLAAVEDTALTEEVTVLQPPVAGSSAVPKFRVHTDPQPEPEAVEVAKSPDLDEAVRSNPTLSILIPVQTDAPPILPFFAAESAQEPGILPAGTGLQTFPAPSLPDGPDLLQTEGVGGKGESGDLPLLPEMNKTRRLPALPAQEISPQTHPLEFELLAGQEVVQASFDTPATPDAPPMTTGKDLFGMTNGKIPDPHPSTTLFPATGADGPTAALKNRKTPANLVSEGPLRPVSPQFAPRNSTAASPSGKQTTSDDGQGYSGDVPKTNSFHIRTVAMHPATGHITSEDLAQGFARPSAVPVQISGSTPVQAERAVWSMAERPARQEGAAGISRQPQRMDVQPAALLQKDSGTSGTWRQPAVLQAESTTQSGWPAKAGKVLSNQGPWQIAQTPAKPLAVPVTSVLPMVAPVLRVAVAKPMDHAGLLRSEPALPASADFKPAKVSAPPAPARQDYGKPPQRIADPAPPFGESGVHQIAGPTAGFAASAVGTAQRSFGEESLQPVEKPASKADMPPLPRTEPRGGLAFMSISAEPPVFGAEPAALPTPPALFAAKAASPQPRAADTAKIDEPAPTASPAADQPAADGPRPATQRGDAAGSRAKADLAVSPLQHLAVRRFENPVALPPAHRTPLDRPTAPVPSGINPRAREEWSPPVNPQQSDAFVEGARGLEPGLLMPPPATDVPIASGQVSDRPAQQPGPTAAPPLSAAPPPNHLPAVLEQAIAGMKNLSDGPIELILTPEDLGRLRFELAVRGEGVVISIAAERPETLDLLRRHSEQLLAELRDAGFSSASLSFGTPDGRHSNGAAQKASGAEHSDQDRPQTNGPVGLQGGADGTKARFGGDFLNLRL